MASVDYNAVRAYLKEKARESAGGQVAAGVGVLLVGIVLLAISFVIVMLGFRYGIQGLMPHPAWVSVIGSIGVLALLFVGNTLASQEDVAEYKVTTAPGDEGYLIQVPRSGLLSDVAETPYGALKAITDFLCIGPRTVAASFRRFKKAERLKKLDLDGCAAVLTVLLMHESKVPFPKIIHSIEGLDAPRVLPQLGDIDGVMFLKKDPQGMSLTSDFRQAFSKKTGIKLDE